MGDPLTDAELAAMRFRLEKASSAPWRRGIGNDARVVFCDAGRIVGECVAKNTGYDDGTFIAHARQDVSRLLADIDRLRDQLRERWPHLTHQMRDRLLALCQAAGTDAGDKWLSEAACETVERLRADNAALRRQVAGPAERCHGQSEALARRAGRTPIVSDPDAASEPPAAPDPPLPRGPAGG